MVKKAKSARKKSSIRLKTPKAKIPQPRVSQTSGGVKVEKILVENFVSLQKVMTNLSVKFDQLTIQISKLLELFEISAKSLAEKESSTGKNKKENEQIIEKIDNLLDQNKTIARGLTLMHEQRPEQRINYPPQQIPRQQPPQPPIQKQEAEKPNINLNEYQKSISSENTESPKFKSLPKNY